MVVSESKYQPLGSDFSMGLLLMLLLTFWSPIHGRDEKNEAKRTLNDCPEDPYLDHGKTKTVETKVVFSVTSHFGFSLPIVLYCYRITVSY